jgi:hypothetical protein
LKSLSIVIGEAVNTTVIGGTSVATGMKPMPQTRKLVCRSDAKLWREIRRLRKCGWELDKTWDEQHHFFFVRWTVHVAWMVRGTRLL